MDATELRVMAARALTEVGGGEGRVWRAAKLLRDRTSASLREIAAAINASLAGAPSAADLPNGSVVAGNDETFIKRGDNPYRPWQGNDGHWCTDADVDEWLKENGATVLRVGTGG